MEDLSSHLSERFGVFLLSVDTAFRHLRQSIQVPLAGLARRARVAARQLFQYRARVHPRGAFISVGDWTPTETSLL